MALKAPLGATYGWRARIGFVTPSPGHENNGYEFYLMAPDGVTIVMTSLHVTQLTQQQYDDAVSRMDVAVAELEDRRVDSIIQAGVPLVVTRGGASRRSCWRRWRARPPHPLPPTSAPASAPCTPWA